jgi:putative transposase
VPAKNSIKIPIENGYYHIYNRGANKQKIFENDQDYSVFLNYLKEALSPVSKLQKVDKFEVEINGTTFLKPKRQPKNFYNKVDLIAYALMPTHFHLLIKQNNQEFMEAFMRSVATRNSMYFNKVHDRTGTLFQGIYKAVLVEDENYLLYLSRYIHLNPKEISANLVSAYSSYANYLKLKNSEWLNPRPVLDYFDQPINPELKKYNDYKKFVESSDADADNQSNNILGDLVLE